MSQALSEPATKRYKHDPSRLAPEILDEDPIDGGRVFFKLLWRNFGKKKAVKVSVGSGGRVGQSDLLVSMHRPLSGFENQVVETRAAASASAPDPGFLIQDYTARIDEL